MKISECMKRAVVSVPASATIREAASIFVARHIGLLPVVDEKSRAIGALGLRDLLSLALPSFVNLVEDVDFVHDFGAVESTRPTAVVLDRPVTTLMRLVKSVNEDCGLLRAYALMIKHELHDLPVVKEDGTLVGIASRVDIGVAIISSWQPDGPTKQ